MRRHWNVLVLVGFAAVTLTVAAPTLRGDSEKPLVRTKRADEIIFDGQTSDGGGAVRVKKSDPEETDVDTKTVEELQTAAGRTETAKNELKPDADNGPQANAAEAETKRDDETAEQEEETGDSPSEKQTGDGDDSVSATSSDETNKRQERAASESLMVAENMAAPEQRLRTKRDLDRDELRQLLDMEPDPYTDYYDNGVEEERLVDERLPFYNEPELEDDTVEPWQYYGDLGRPKRLYSSPLDEEALEEEEAYDEDAEREVVRELLAERAAEEAREALLAYIAGGEPKYTALEDEDRGGIWAYDPSTDTMSDLDEGLRQEFVTNARQRLGSDDDEDEEEEAEEMAEKRFYPYSYEPYGGRWGAVVPGSKREDPDPYDRLYRLAEVLSRPPRLRGEDYEYEK